MFHFGMLESQGLRIFIYLKYFSFDLYMQLDLYLLALNNFKNYCALIGQ